MDIEYIEKYDNELIDLVNRYPVHFTRMIKSKGFHKNKTKNREYLLEYVKRCTPMLQDSFYTLKTRVYWTIHHMQDFPTCKNPDCGKKLTRFNVKKMKEGYVSFCSRDCMYSSTEWKRSVKEGFTNKYGVDNVFKSENFKSRMSERKTDIQRTKNDSKRRNHTFKASERENEAYRLLCDSYGKENVRRQYDEDERYPFNCDFYIQDKDLFIEFNGSWTHGTHPYDENSEDDRKQLEMWKGNNSDFYRNAIETWTIRDVRKRNTAKENNLNFREFWTIGELRKFLGCENPVDSKSLFVRWDRKKAEYEFNYYRDKKVDDFPKTCSTVNYIVRYFQQDSFFREEKKIWENDSLKREKLILNRCKYLDKKPEDLTYDELLSGFKKSGMHYGYSHFNPLIFKWFIEKFGIKSCYDPCGGWGHRLLGGLALEKYIYNDFSTSTKENVDRIIEFFKIKNTKTSCKDARTFLPEDDFDAMFTCPPYFNVERYECGDFKDIHDYNGFLDSLFDKFHSKKCCKVFGLVIRDDFLTEKHNDYSEKITITEKNEIYLDSLKKSNSESLFIFEKM